MQHEYLGIDIGGTFVKFGLVNAEGILLKFHKVPTAELIATGDFVQAFIELLKIEFDKYPHIEDVGIGVPGTLNKERSRVLEVPAIPALNGLEFAGKLSAQFPNKHFVLENDANAAALGELHFSGQAMPSNFFFITLGTGVGGAAIIDNEIFKGGDGNSMEIGHVMSHHDRSLEQNIGKKGMLDLAAQMLSAYEHESLVRSRGVLGSQMLIKAADDGDELALAVFHKVGYLLAEALVAAIRIIDIKSIVIGGGLSACFQHIHGPIMELLHQKLTPYYTKDLQLMRARLGNDAGLIGAAALCLKRGKLYVK
jgi:glucokinase